VPAPPRGAGTPISARPCETNFVRKPANPAVRDVLAARPNIGFNGTFTGSGPAPVTLTLNGNTCPVT
jgi:hypothetical protein